MHERSEKRNFPHHQQRKYPPEDATQISELGFSIGLQAILDVNVERLLQTLQMKLGL